MDKIINKEEDKLDEQLFLEFSKKKKNKKKKVELEEEIIEKEQLTTELAKVDTPLYSYSLLLDRVYQLLNEKNPNVSNIKKYKLPPIQLIKNGTKKIVWINFNEICSIINRSLEHIFQYFIAELGVEGSIDELQQFNIKGKFAPLYIESILRKYIIEYVLCLSCQSFNTKLTKDKISRLYFLFCNDCACSKSVSHIKSGYHAETRADRILQKNKI
jgi:translation initiation factor 2 subunit 2